MKPTDTIDQVRAQYERFPYPAYPSMLRPCEREAILCSSQFQECLRGSINDGERHSSRRQFGQRKNILVLGCGDTQPWYFHKLETQVNKLTFLDLSKTNLTRARQRIGMASRCHEWVHSSLEDFLSRKNAEAQGQYSHIDAFGVLHHLERPDLALNLISKALEEGGTLRLMLYNQISRSWIHHIQDLFASLNLSPYSSTDRNKARKILNILKTTPHLKRYFDGLGSRSLSNNSRLVDTFFHANELRWPLKCWNDELYKAGLKAHAVFDRYAELDDLYNPLWVMPSIQKLSERAKDRRFENNLEVFIHKPKKQFTATKNESSSPSQRDFAPPVKQDGISHMIKRLRHRNDSPPRFWFSFSETRSIKKNLRTVLAQIHRCHMLGKNSQAIDHSDLRFLPTPSLQRLARLGAILPSMVADRGLRENLLAPMADHMESPEIHNASADFVQHISSKIQGVFVTDKRHQQMKRPSDLNDLIQRLLSGVESQLKRYSV